MHDLFSHKTNTELALNIIKSQLLSFLSTALLVDKGEHRAAANCGAGITFQVLMFKGV